MTPKPCRPKGSSSVNRGLVGCLKSRVSSEPEDRFRLGYKLIDLLGVFHKQEIKE